MDKPLDGLKILVLDDEFLVSLEIQTMIEALGGTVVGPTGQLHEAQALANEQTIDGAILDVKLREHTSMSLAEDLSVRGIPFILMTGYDREMLPARFSETPRLAKPFDANMLRKIAMQTFPRKLRHDAQK
jgi:DNA-binding NtrC family response regulator